MWKPISISKLMDDVNRTEYYLYGNVLKFWEFIKIVPEKWQEQQYGMDGGGFWVVAIFGNQILYYNDIEEGWTYSTYHKYGLIDVYQSGEYKLRELIGTLHSWLCSNYDEVKP